MILYKEIKYLFKIFISQPNSNMCFFDWLSGSKIKHACTWHTTVKTESGLFDWLLPEY